MSINFNGPPQSLPKEEPYYSGSIQLSHINRGQIMLPELLKLSLLLNSSQPEGSPVNFFAIPNSDQDAAGRRTYTCFQDVTAGNPETLRVTNHLDARVISRGSAVERIEMLFKWQNKHCAHPWIKGYNVVCSEDIAETLTRALTQPVITTHPVSVTCHDGMAAVFRENRLIIANYRPIVATAPYDPFNL